MLKVQFVIDFTLQPYTCTPCGAFNFLLRGWLRKPTLHGTDRPPGILSPRRSSNVLIVFHCTSCVNLTRNRYNQAPTTHRIRFVYLRPLPTLQGYVVRKATSALASSSLPPNSAKAEGEAGVTTTSAVGQARKFDANAFE